MCNHIFPEKVTERVSPGNGWDYIQYICADCGEEVGAQVSVGLYKVLDE